MVKSAFTLILLWAMAGACLPLANAADREEQLPAEWRFPARPPLIHVARGLWWELLRIPEAGALMGGARYSASHDVYGGTDGYHGCGRTLEEFPHSYENLLAHNVIVIAGCRAGALPVETRKRLRQWVEHGGGLLVTGGLQGLGQGQYHDTALEELLPVAVAAAPDLMRAALDAVLVPTEAGKRFFGGTVPWAQQPMVFYCHQGLVVKPGAEILVNAAGQPLLVRHAVGNGRVAVFAGTVCGEPMPGQLAFWEWDGWPVVLARVITWLAETPPPEPADGSAKDEDPVYTQKRKRLEELGEFEIETMLTDETSNLGEEKESRAFARLSELATACRDREYALAVANALAQSGAAFSVEAGETLFERLDPYICGPVFAEVGRDLAGRKKPGPVALGMRLLGRSKAPGGDTVVLKCLSRGLAALDHDGAGKAGLGLRVPDGVDERLRLAAVRAVIDYGPVVPLSALRKAVKAGVGERALVPLVEQLQRDLAEETQIALCLLGDGEAAVTLLRTLIENKLKIEANLDLAQKPIFVLVPELIRARKNAEEALPLLRTRNARIETILAQVPEKSLLALAQVADEWKGEFAAEYLQACFAERNSAPPAGEVRDALLRMMEKCHLAPIRMLCAQRLRRAASDPLVGLIARLSRGDAADAEFALSQAPFLAAPNRVEVVRAGLEHGSQAVRQKAARAIPLVAGSEQGPLWKLVRELAKQNKEIAAMLKDMAGKD